ncbi:glycine zipper family protein [Pseudoalteromonas sp. C2R02]|uniref:glycine zipper family protein n=1 Tax=Pseudoalteromonas sp. C2R02 TaxID=2841565 RepID=UPI001C0A128A|nr:YMGG-like glycine zipper-containing protein [Pseudoalteromonas sp. C2R02]MBU2972005.1 glycine zipper family protein [Pseudoalteromonas sp. C2R02]
MKHINFLTYLLPQFIIKAILITLSIFIIGCADRTPIVDTKGIDIAVYEKDLSECQTYANQVSTGESAAKHGTVGAVTGAVLGAIIGNSTTAGQGAGVGAVTGSVKGGQRAEHKKEHVIRNCLRGRGYRVLG